MQPMTWNPFRRTRAAVAFLFATVLVPGEPTAAQLVERAREAAEVIDDRWTGYQIEQFAVPMRDGVRLNTYVLKPKELDSALPIVLVRTPYGWIHEDGDPWYKGDFFSDVAIQRALIEEEFIFVAQDERGRYGSEGVFEVLRPFRSVADPGAVDDPTDTYDTIEWALRAITGHNGRVGLHGNSYRGWHVMAGLIDPHPAVKAAVPSAAMSEGFIGDDFYHNGAFHLSYALRFIPLNMDRFGFDQVSNPLASGVVGRDEYGFYLEHGTMSELKRFFPSPAYHTNAIIRNDVFNEFYHEREVRRFIAHEVSVPTLHVVSWYDAEDLYGPLTFYHTMEGFDEADQNFLVAGPWYHGAWRYEGSDQFGPLHFGSLTGPYFQKEVLLPFFRYHLKAQDAIDLPEAHLFDPGRNEWESYDQWPPEGATPLRLYLHADGSASFSPPTSGDESHRTYLSDPASPVPYYPRPNHEGFRREYKVIDQRFALERPDVLTFTTAPLDRDLTIAGPAVARLFASTTGTDTDWVVKVVDAYPEDHPEPGMRGCQRMVFGEIFRAKFRSGFENPQPLEPGAVLSYDIPLLEQLHTVKKGHRLVVHLQSSWFPLFDRNPNSFMRIWEATEADYQPVEQKVFLSNRFPTHIELTVVGGREAAGGT